VWATVIRTNRNSAYAGTRNIWVPDRAPLSNIEYAGAPQTIQVMRRAVREDQDHLETRQLCEVICENVDSKDYTSEMLAVFYFMLQNTRYMRDPRRVELVRAPYVISKMILDGHVPSVDCDDLATWLAAAVIAMGGRAEFVTVAFEDMFYGTERQYSHVFTCGLEPRTRQKVVLDPVAAEKTKQMLGRVKAARVYGIAA
jgi:hypothetical protein